ncbi:MAG: HNH endonuclease signature motif containing protein [Cyanobacteria bacterium P01_G01_bin.54]
MTDDLSHELNRLYQEQILGAEKREQVLEQTDAVLAKARQLLNPRRQFMNWARSEQGQAWKIDQFERQGGQCARCQKCFSSLQEVEIHHVRSLHDLGRQANHPENYRLLCTLCNRQLGTAFDATL